jgi:hypothetical protein
MEYGSVSKEYVVRKVHVYRELPVNEQGQRLLDAAPTDWKAADPVINYAVRMGELINGMRLEDVVLSLGVPASGSESVDRWVFDHAGYKMWFAWRSGGGWLLLDTFKRIA